MARDFETSLERRKKDRETAWLGILKAELKSDRKRGLLSLSSEKFTAEWSKKIKRQDLSFFHLNFVLKQNIFPILKKYIL